MFRTSAGCVFSALLAGLLVWPYSAVFGANLSDEAVREAYFLGQRNDEKTARFLETYRRLFPLPQSGLYVSEIELFTPYAETVDLSRQRTFGYSAQQAAQEYRDRGDVFRLRVRVFFTDTYSLRTYAQTATQKDGRKTGLGQDPRTHSNGSQGFQVQLWQKDRLIDQIVQIVGDPNEREWPNEIVLEVRAGVGGEEASLFAEELAQMYVKYAQSNITQQPSFPGVAAEFDLAKLP